jgi:chemotaxis protein methyltransferase CheR
MNTLVQDSQGIDEDMELELLLEGVFRTYHHDFRHYVRSSLRRRVEEARVALRLPTITRLLDAILHDPAMFAKFLGHMTIQVSDFFRDPSYWRSLQVHVLPHLETYPFLRVWIAGCGAGEEAYSMAILLSEAGLLERSQIYATDIASASLEEAARGLYALDRVRSFSSNYLQAGGRASLSDYYGTTRSHAAFAPELRRRILFSDHSLATDSAFAEVQLVSCRNVLIYFDRALQDRAVSMFAESLCPRGFLGLGRKESLALSVHVNQFDTVVADDRIYRKRANA